MGEPVSIALAPERLFLLQRGLKRAAETVRVGLTSDLPGSRARCSFSSVSAPERRAIMATDWAADVKKYASNADDKAIAES